MEALRTQWADWVETYASDKPFTAGPLQGSRLKIVSGENPVLEVVFSNISLHDLFLSDPKNKNDLRAFLISRLDAETSFTLDFKAESSETPPTFSPASLEGIDDLCRREPIIKTLLELFEGRILDRSN